MDKVELIDLTQFEKDGGFTIKLVGPSGLIAADTLIETLAGFSESLCAIGETVNPKFALEVFITSVEPGSVNIVVQLKQHLKRNAAVYAGAALATDIIVGLFTNYVYDLVKPQEACAVDFSEEKITIKGSNCNVIIPREVYNLRPRIHHNPKVAKGVMRALKAVETDHSVRSIGVGTKLEGPPVMTVPRAYFSEALRRLDWPIDLPRSERLTMIEEPGSLGFETREQDVRSNMIIVKAVLLRSKRKWQFNWQGIRISAPITDPNFFDQLEARAIALRQGDALDANLTIVQRFLPDARVWENAGYTVTKVYSIRLGEMQTTMDLVTSAANAPELPPILGDTGAHT
jgi:hypothetical protein